MVQVIAYLDVDQDLYHTSYIYTGLLELARRSKIALDVSNPTTGDWRKSPLGDACVYLDVRSSGEPERRVCFDLWDKSDRFCATSLQNCDLYFKRSFFRPDLADLPESVRHKVVPFGLNYSCSTIPALPHLLRAGWKQWSVRQVPNLFRLLYHYYKLRRPEEFLWEPDLPKQPGVLLQTRVWEEAEVIGDSAQAINQTRVEIVRSLKAAFSDRFVGGLIPNRLARERYPDLLTHVSSDPQAYTTLNRNTLIGVYTRGLHHSTAWKLGEYCAASMCVVAEPIRNELPHSIEEGKHYLGFTSGEECVAACRRIIDDDALQWQLRSSAFNYFEEHIAPAAHLAECIEKIRTWT